MTNETICAISTAPGVGGIAVIRVSGPEAIAICDRLFQARRAGKTLSAQPAYSLTYGTLAEGGEIDRRTTPMLLGFGHCNATGRLGPWS